MDHGILVEVFDGSRDALLELLFGSNADMAQDGACKLGKETLDEVEPRAVLGRERELETAGGLSSEPSFGLLGDVRGMIVEDQFDRGMSRIGSVEKLEEFDELAAAMAILDQGVDLAGEQINSGQQSAFRSYCSIARMPEIVRTFSSAERRDKRANSSVKSGDGALCSLAQKCFELAEGHLDGIEVGRILRQIAKCRPRTLDSFPYAWGLVSAEVIHHDDIIALERGNQALLDIGKEHFSVHGTLDHERCDHSIVPQCGYEGDRLPMPVRYATNQPHATRAATLEPRHIGADRSLVDKHQPGWVKHALLPDPALTRSGHVGALLLCCSQTFF